MGLLFEAFLKQKATDFQSIARATKGAISAEELHSEAWLIAHEIVEKRGREVDYSDPADQTLILSRLNFRNVAKGDWKFRRAISLDQEPDDDEAGTSLLERLSSDNAPDPLDLLLMQETRKTQEEAEERAIAASFSQAAAYVIVFDHFDSSRKRICAHLMLHRSTLYKRVRRATETFYAQSSLFDRITSIDRSFTPLLGREWRRWTQSVDIGTQSQFEF